MKMFEFCITSITRWVGSQKTTNLALRNFEIFPNKFAQKYENQFFFFSPIFMLTICAFTQALNK